MSNKTCREETCSCKCENKCLNRQALELCWEIEKLPASEQQTKVSSMASNLLRQIENVTSATDALKSITNGYSK